ncbi:MAG: AAA family ATPase, partial [Campylobacterales bacterium]|nr:AAA family ATPase [Campylobacterales bacterium]
MLKRMILINSANFQFADIDLSKEIFFVGDNASGKTTTTRALHFLYNGDGQKLGIPRSKDTFLKHYFSHDDSYIIYVFDSFFIFTYVRNNTIRRWFSKQVFDITKVIKDKQLLEFKEIEGYIKSATLRYKPTTIEEYIATLYGENKKYLDFSIAKIQNHKIFLELFNMIFNIDKAIVTASDIKRAIQKSLDRKDETLSIDYEDFIRRLNGFSSSYHFFKILDSVRG